MLLGIENNTFTLENSLAVFSKFKYTISMRFSHFIPRYFPQRNQNVYPHKYLFLNFHAALFIVVSKCKQPKCLSAGEWKQTVRLPYRYYYSAITRNELWMHMTTWINLTCIILREKKPFTKVSILYNCTYLQLWKKQNYSNLKKTGGLELWEGIIY